MSERILIAGIGNIFLGDDAFGVEVVRRLARQPLPGAVRIADFGIRGFDLAYALMDGYEATILADAMPRGGAPGSLYTIEPDLQATNSPQPEQSPVIDAHSLDPVAVLRLVKTLGGECKRVLVVGCEPESFGTEDGAQGRMGLSEPVERAIDDAVQIIVSLIAGMLRAPEIRENIFRDNTFLNNTRQVSYEADDQGSGDRACNRWNR